MKSDILVIHGSNLNILGKRECDIYGTKTLIEINTELVSLANDFGLALECYQSNIEGEIINKIHSNCDTKCIIINAGAFTHTSIAIRDALLSNAALFYEVHISNIYAREHFRHNSFLSDIAQGVICGCGTFGYILALRAAVEYLS